MTYATDQRSVTNGPTGRAVYTVMVKWDGEKRARRLGHGQTVTTRAKARRFRTRLAAEFAIRTEVMRAFGVAEAWVKVF